MFLPKAEVEKLRDIISICRQVGIEVVVVDGKQVLGANEARNLAIISETDISFQDGVKLGIGRVSELDKRLNLFAEAEATLKVSEKGEISVITFSAGKSKAQFRCTSLALLERRYPKENADQPLAVVGLNKAEVAQFYRAVKTFGAASVVLRVDRTGGSYLECSDQAVGDRFTMDLEKSSQFLDEAEPFVFTYVAPNFCQLVDMAAKDSEEVDLVIGQAGSLTALVKGHTFVASPLINEE
jgi:hypothetical protein